MPRPPASRLRCEPRIGSLVRVVSVDQIPTTPALRLSGLVKRFAGKLAVGGLSLEVPAGSFFGLVGPNGAGKTTTLSMATGLLRPDAGTAEVHGVDVWQHPVE